jgi:hypothetical protein
MAMSLSPTSTHHPAHFTQRSWKPSPQDPPEGPTDYGQILQKLEKNIFPGALSSSGEHGEREAHRVGHFYMIFNHLSILFVSTPYLAIFA